jgi:hypothetical protein
MFQKNALGCNSFSHDGIEKRTGKDYRFPSNGARPQQSPFQTLASNATAQQRKELIQKVATLPFIQNLKYGQIMHLADIVGNGRCEQCAKFRRVLDVAVFSKPDAENHRHTREA